MGVEATTFYKRLGSLLSHKWDISYQDPVLALLRYHLSLSLLRSAIQAISGARLSQGQAARSPLIVDLWRHTFHHKPPTHYLIVTIVDGYSF